MAENGARLDARSRQLITARKNQLRDQAKEQRVTRTSETKKKQKRTIQIHRHCC